MEHVFSALPLFPSHANIGRENQDYRGRGKIYCDATSSINMELLRSSSESNPDFKIASHQ